MSLTRLLPVALCLAMCACTQADAPAAAGDAPAVDAAATADAGPADAAANAASEPAPVAAARDRRETAEGSIDFAVTGRTIARNSRGDAGSVQCQLDFKASNRSQAQVKSVVAEFRIATAADDVVIDAESTLTLPFEIPPGETRDAWGPIVIDNHRCEDLALALQPRKAAMCRTKDKGPCPAYALSGDGVASAG